MSNHHQESVLKEANELLENAQKEVLKEINTKRNLLSRIFKGDKTESLKQAQSSISRAINQMQNFTRDESSLIVKLQNHLNERSNKIKSLEERFNENEKRTSDLKDKIKFYEQEFEKLRSTPKEVEVEIKPPAEHHRIEEDLRAKIQELEDGNREIQSCFNASREEAGHSRELNLELSARMKRLKAEITNN